MKNSYYLVTLPPNRDIKLITDIRDKGVKGVVPRNNVHWRYSLDGTKAIVQGLLTEDIKNFIQGKGEVLYLGDCLDNGQADPAIFEFLSKNASEWVDEGK